MNASNYLENAALRHVLGIASFTPPSTVYCGLSTTTPNDAGNVTEPSGGSYARQVVAFNVSGTTPTTVNHRAFGPGLVMSWALSGLNIRRPTGLLSPQNLRASF